MLNRHQALLLTASLLALSTPAVVHAEDAQTTEETIVTVTRQPVALSKVGQAVAVLTDADIKSYQSLLIADLLARTPDLSLARNGGPGSATTASLRGAGGDHTLYLLDGVRLNDPSQVGGGTNLGLLGTDDASRIEVLRGPLSTLWGSGALGGVVSITTHQATQAIEGNLSLEGLDRYGAARLGVGGQWGKLSWHGFASTVNDQGVSSFDGGTEKDGFTQTTLNGKLAYAVTDTLTAALFSSQSHSRNAYDGYPAPDYTFADTGDFGKTDTNLTVASLTHSFAKGQQVFSISETETKRNDFNPDHTPNFVSKGHIESADYHISYSLSDTTRLLGGVSYERDTMRYAYPSSWDPTPTPQKAASTLASVYGQISQDFGPLVVTGSARHDDASSFGGLDIAQLSASLPVGDHWRFHASTGTGVKVPSLYQLYSDYGNSALKPEKSQSLDGGVDYASASGQFGATLFTRQVRDQIDFASCYGVTSAICTSHPYGYYDNIARTKASGLELEASQTLSEQWAVKGNYTFLTTRNESTTLKGKRLARTPDQMGNIDLSYAANAKLDLSVSVRYVGESFDNASNTLRLKDYTLADLRAAYVLTPRVELYGRIENLTDAHYETAYGYGQVGRRVWLGVHTRLF